MELEKTYIGFLPDPMPEVLTIAQIAERWRMKWNTPADAKYVLGCYERGLQFCTWDVPTATYVDYSQKELIEKVRMEVGSLALLDFVGELPRYENTMLRVRAKDLLAFENRETPPAKIRPPEQNVDAATGKTTTNKLRRNTLDPAIDKAITEAESHETADVYLKLRELALAEEKPFTGHLNGDALCYTDGNNTEAQLTKEALGKRLKNRR